VIIHLAPKPLRDEVRIGRTRLHINVRIGFDISISINTRIDIVVVIVRRISGIIAATGSQDQTDQKNSEKQSESMQHTPFLIFLTDTKMSDLHKLQKNKALVVRTAAFTGYTPAFE
jgi:hypothetical protein